MSEFNPLVHIDSYNISHEEMYYPSSSKTSYIYNRNAPIRIAGLAGLIHQLLETRITVEMLEEAEELAKESQMEFPSQLFNYIIIRLDGKIPLKFEMLPEFIWIPKGTPFCKITNTDPKCSSLVTMWEGYLTHAYFTSLCYTRAKGLKDIGIDNIHNFGYRGAQSDDAAVKSAFAMGLVYPGTDTFLATEQEGLFYELYPKQKFGTIPAASHAIIQSYPSEMEAYKTLIKKYSNGGSVAFPIDTYNTDRFINEYSRQVMSYAIECDTNLFLRLDSGNISAYLSNLLTLIKHLPDIDKKKFGIIIGDNLTKEDIVKYDTQVKGFVRVTMKWPNEDYIPFWRGLVYYGWGSNFYNDLIRENVGWVMKLGLVDDRIVMKTAKGKESLGGDLYVEIIDDYFYVSENPEYNSYIPYSAAPKIHSPIEEPNHRKMPELRVDTRLDMKLKGIQCDLNGD